jgi:hypothetical protein
MAARGAAELFGQMFSLMLEAREHAQARDYEARGRAVTDRLLATVAQDNDLLDDPQWLADVIGDAIPADGIGIFMRGQLSLVGLTPSAAQFEAIVRMLNRVSSGQVFATESIQTLVPEAAGHADVAAGMLAIPLSREPRDYVVLFRAERLREVRWGQARKGHGLWPQRPAPDPAQELRGLERAGQGHLPALHPRAAPRGRSLARGHARSAGAAGRDCRGRARARLRAAGSADRRAQPPRAQHPLADPGLIAQTREGAQDVATFIATLDDRIRSLARAHDQITADRWGPAPLLELIEVEASAYLRDRSHRIVARGENVLLYPVAYVTMALVIHELTTNAAKYGALADSGTVDLSWDIERESGDLVIDWRERDGPEVREPGHRGFGSTIIERSIPYDLGAPRGWTSTGRASTPVSRCLRARSPGLRRRGHMAPCRSGPRADARRWRARTRCWSRTA